MLVQYMCMSSYSLLNIPGKFTRKWHIFTQNASTESHKTRGKVRQDERSARAKRTDSTATNVPQAVRSPETADRVAARRFIYMYPSARQHTVVLANAQPRSLRLLCSRHTLRSRCKVRPDLVEGTRSRFVYRIDLARSRLYKGPRREIFLYVE
ncbi:hypothetical protein PUN28_009334 [Cardiocondyla obscurior]|uniref:Uncharacterized protein n=1 Tax=Cardiocondyla obscurior TaxID=286306 RepID=A0AAW2FV12_9HYME